MATVGLEFAQLFLRGRQSFAGARRNGLAEARQQLGIDRIGLGQQTTGPSVLAHSTRLDQAKINPASLQGREQSALVAPAGFPDHLDGRVHFGQTLHQLPVTANIIADPPGRLLPGDIEMGLGHINSDLDFFFLHVVRISCL